MKKICGFDISPTHGAGVAIDGYGRVIDFVFYSDRAAAFKHTKKNGVDRELAARHGVDLSEIAKIPDIEQRDMARLVPTMRMFLQMRDRLGPKAGPGLAGIEAYAFAASKGAHTKGEICGLLRLVLTQRQWQIRLQDPKSVKIFACGNGDAEKDEVLAGALKKWGDDRLDCFEGVAAQEHADLVDAYVIARMVQTEWLLRNGVVQVKDLPPEEVRVFNRVTKAQPVNILGRWWAYDAAGAR